MLSTPGLEDKKLSIFEDSKHKNEEHYIKKLFSCSVCKKECKAQIDLAEHMLDEHQIIYKYLHVQT